MTNAASTARRPLPPPLTLFLLHLYAAAAFFGWLGTLILQEALRYSEYSFWNDEQILMLIACGAVAVWSVFLIRAIHSRSANTPKQCRIFCRISLMLCAVGTVPIFLLSGLLGLDELRKLLFFPLAGLIFYGCCLYWLTTSTSLRWIFADKPPSFN